MSDWANTRVEYLYRDASNYKAHKIVVLAGELTEKEVATVFANTENMSTVGEFYFLPEQVGLESLVGTLGDGTITEDDHPWHELELVEPTTAAADLDPSLPSASEWAASFIDIVWDDVAASKAMEDL